MLSKARALLLLVTLASASALCQSAPQPQVFEPGVISVGSYVTSAEFTPDGKYFIRGSARDTKLSAQSRMTTAESEKVLHSPGNGLGAIYIIDAGALPVKPVK